MKTYFTADWHHGSKNIIKYCNRPFSCVEEMNNSLIENYNNIVTKRDKCYFLGDMVWGHHNYKSVFEQLNGEKFIILGNHDTEQSYKKLLIDHVISGLYKVKSLTIDNNYIWMSHYPHRSWNMSSHGSFHLYGHCIDMDTEILTYNGWKTRNDVFLNDEIITYNLETNKLELDCVKNIIDNYFSGDVYNIKSKGIDLRVTDEHVLIDVKYWNKDIGYEKFLAKDFTKKSTRTFLKCGIFEKCTDINISDDYIRLLIWIAADGSLCNSNLIRLRFYKQRKIERFRALLKRLGIIFSENKQKNGAVYFNFNAPHEISGFRLKPLDNTFMICNKRVFEILLDKYSCSDGYKNGNNILIYTSKKTEVDIIQMAAIINGYMCSVNKRENHGFSKIPNYEISINLNNNKNYRRIGNTTNHVFYENVICEHFWCVETRNKTLVARRNGKVSVIGNCHNTLKEKGRSIDVGVDRWDYKPVEWSEIYNILKNRNNKELYE
jgi:calcineurin-like phosphoesterase family protein